MLRRALNFIGVIFMVGLAVPTAASLLIRGGVALPGFPFVISGLTVQANSTNPQIPGLSTASVTDPINDYNCAGINTTTTGTISSGTNSLAVASATGWSNGMGIAVHNAGAGGTTELISYITNIGGTTFTLHDNASATATTQTVNHDDTRCLTAAIGSGQNVHLRLGNYNMTSELDITTPLIFSCEGQVGNNVQGLYSPNAQNASGGTVIWNRSLTANMVNVSSGFVTIRDCTWQQVGTPTAGYWLVVGNGSNYILHDIIADNEVNGTYNGVSITGHVASMDVTNNQVFTVGGSSNSNGNVQVNNASPAGDIKWIGNEFSVLSAGPDLVLTRSDIEWFIGNKFNGCDPCVNIGGNAVGQSFVGDSFESGVNSGALITISGSTGTVFTGGECGVDNGKGCFAISGVADGAVIGMNFSDISGTPIANTSSRLFREWGNTSSNSSAVLALDRLAGYTYSGLPNDPKVGSIAYITDADACTYGSTVTHTSGSTFCKVVYNGSNWIAN